MRIYFAEGRVTSMWGGFTSCGGLVTRLRTSANGPKAPVGNRRAGYHPAPHGWRHYKELGRRGCALFHRFAFAQALEEQGALLRRERFDGGMGGPVTLRVTVRR